MSHILTSSIKKRLPGKLIAGFTAFAATVLIGASSFAFATPADKPTKEECREAGFKNYGQCVKEWRHDKNPPGHGYGYGGQKHCHHHKHGHKHGHGEKHKHCHQHKHGQGHHNHGHKHKHGHD